MASQRFTVLRNAQASAFKPFSRPTRQNGGGEWRQGAACRACLVNPSSRSAEAVVPPLIRSFSSAVLSVLKGSTSKRKPCPCSPEPAGAEGQRWAEPLGAAPPRSAPECKAAVTLGRLAPGPLPAALGAPPPARTGYSARPRFLYPTLPNELALSQPLVSLAPRALAREVLRVLRLASEGRVCPRALRPATVPRSRRRHPLCTENGKWVKLVNYSSTAENMIRVSPDLTNPPQPFLVEIYKHVGRCPMGTTVGTGG